VKDRGGKRSSPFKNHLFFWNAEPGRSPYCRFNKLREAAQREFRNMAEKPQSEKRTGDLARLYEQTPAGGYPSALGTCAQRFGGS
jgi:hypothetical protein